MFCPNCGTKNPDGSKFCGNCGCLLEVEDVKATTALHDKSVVSDATPAEHQTLQPQNTNAKSTQGNSGVLESPSQRKAEEETESVEEYIIADDAPGAKGKWAILAILAIVLAGIGIYFWKFQDNGAFECERFDYRMVEDVSESPNGSVSGEYAIDWPVSGERKEVEFVRKWIAECICGSSVEDDYNSSKPNDLIESRFKEVLSQASDGLCREDVTVTVNSIAEGFITLDFSSENAYFMAQQEPIEVKRAYVRLSDMAVLTRDMLPDNKAMSRLIRQHISEGVTLEAESLPLPTKINPVFTKEGLELLYEMYEIAAGAEGMPRVTIPYKDIFPLLSEEARAFVPEQLVKDLDNLVVPESEIEEKSLTEDVVIKLWEGIPNGGLNELTESSLSRDFYNLCFIGFSMPSTYPGGIGDEEFLNYWYSGPESGEDDHISSMSLSSVDDGKATAKVKYMMFGTPQTFTLNLVLEKDVDESQTWRIDNFLSESGNMREKIYNFVNTYGPKFKNGFANEILADPDAGGCMSDDEKKEYLERADEFISKFDKVYPDGKVKR